jgi:hypothetical protein
MRYCDGMQCHLWLWFCFVNLSVFMLCIQVCHYVIILAQGAAWGSDPLLRQLLCLNAVRMQRLVVGWFVIMSSRLISCSFDWHVLTTLQNGFGMA